MKFLYPLLAVLLIAASLPTQAETAYQHFMRIAEQARQRGDFNTALINYGRAHKEKPRDSDLNAAVSELLKERLQGLEESNPEYVENIQIADGAYTRVTTTQ